MSEDVCGRLLTSALKSFWDVPCFVATIMRVGDAVAVHVVDVEVVVVVLVVLVVLVVVDVPGPDDPLPPLLRKLPNKLKMRRTAWIPNH
jgi:hypothetical protein